MEAYDRAGAVVQHRREEVRREAVGHGDPGREVGVGVREEGGTKARGAPAAGTGAAGHDGRRCSGRGRGLVGTPGRRSGGYRGAGKVGAARGASGAEDLFASGFKADGVDEGLA